MFGFPESVSEWGPREYLRLFAIVAFYLTVRPLLQKFYTRLGERQRAREKKKVEDEQIRRNQQQRVREKLGASETEQPDGQTRRRRRRAALQEQEQEPVKPVDDMPSDEDVSDLLS